MKPYSIFLIIAFAAGILSCKKNNTDQFASVSNESGKQLSTWYDNQLKALSVKTMTVLGADQPDWARSKFFTGQGLYITPVPLKEKGKAAKFFIAKQEGSGFKEGSYFVFLTKKGAVLNNPEQLILNRFNNVVSDYGNFSGAIMQYDMDNKLISAAHFKDGVKTGASDNIVYKPEKVKTKSEEGPVGNVAPLECGEGVQPYCIDWYWQTYINGELVEEEYLYTTCYCQNPGGAGSSNPCQSQCTAQFNSLVSGTSVAGDMFTCGAPIQINPDEIQLAYRWRALKNITWSIYSNEKAVLKKTNLPPLQPQWKYVSLQHESLTFEGFSAGGTVSYTATSTPTVGIYNASMELGLDVTYSATPCCGLPAILPPLTVHYNASRFFNVNYVYQ